MGPAPGRGRGRDAGRRSSQYLPRRALLPARASGTCTRTYPRGPAPPRPAPPPRPPAPPPRATGPVPAAPASQRPLPCPPASAAPPRAAPSAPAQAETPRPAAPARLRPPRAAPPPRSGTAWRRAARLPASSFPATGGRDPSARRQRRLGGGARGLDARGADAGRDTCDAVPFLGCITGPRSPRMIQAWAFGRGKWSAGATIRVSRKRSLALARCLFQWLRGRLGTHRNQGKGVRKGIKHLISPEIFQ